MSLFADSPRLYPGVAELVSELSARGVRLAVVSTTWRGNIEVALSSALLASHFETVVGKEDVSQTKPDPEAYELALKRLKLGPEAVVALEDSATGLASARRAGVRAVAVGHRQPRGEWADGAPFVESLARVSEVLALLGWPDATSG
jgi:HAD superfamily hydrolase (TIGR01509 family)